MIHFTCDCCKRPIDPATEIRYVVRMEVYAAVEDGEQQPDEERDYLDEIESILERADELDGIDDVSDVYKQVSFDLCSECHKAFMKNPLGRTSVSALDFSNN